MVSLAIAYHSGFGHTRKVAEAVAEGAARQAGTVHIVAVDGITEADWQALDGADAILFGSPTYMGGVSAPFKAFIDATSRRWLQQRWKNKLAAGFTNSGHWGGDKFGTLMQIMVFALQHSMIWAGCSVMPETVEQDGRTLHLNRMGSFAGLMTLSGNDSPEVTPPEEDLETARRFGERIAEVARGFRK